MHVAATIHRNSRTSDSHDLAASAIGLDDWALMGKR